MANDKKIFAVMIGSSTESLQKILAAEFVDAHLSVGPGQWLIIGPNTMTTQELSIKLGMASNDAPNAGIVLSVNSYFGRAPLNIWEWLTAKMGDKNGATGS